MELSEGRLTDRRRTEGLTVGVVSVDFLGVCTFVALGDDLTPPGLVLLLADVLVKQTVCEEIRCGEINRNEAETTIFNQSTKLCGALFMQHM